MPVATEAHHRRIAEMTYASVHPLYVTKVEKKVRVLDKLVDELAKGRAMEKIMR